LTTPNERDQGVLNAITWAQKEDGSMSAGINYLAAYREAVVKEEREKVLAEVESLIDRLACVVTLADGTQERVVLAAALETMLRGEP
jgi:hypothetical protein